MHCVVIAMLLGLEFAARWGFTEHLSLERTLHKLAIVHRHGDRTPRSTYPNDPYRNESHWPDGWGQLTVKGKKRLYSLGKFIRKRYSTFLTDDPGEVKVRSSGANRCLNSVQCLLTGAYPPKGRFVIDPELNWQPFPVQTKPRIEEEMLNPGAYCPAISAERKKIPDTPEYQACFKKYKDLLKHLSTVSGGNISSLFSAASLRDTLSIEKEEGFTLPDWATDDVMSQLKDIGDNVFHFLGMLEKIQRLNSGVFFKDLVDKFGDKIIDNRDITKTEDDDKEKRKKQYEDRDDSGPEKKLFLYSTHDAMISIVLQAMNQFNMLIPPYAASVIFELHQDGVNGDTGLFISRKDIGDEFYIRIFYLNDTEKEVLHQLLPPGCQSSDTCLFNDFVKAVPSLSIDDWKSECQFPSKKSCSLCKFL